jgi:hypothetical protein
MTDPQPTASSDEPVPPIRIAGSELGAKRHVCAFFRSPEEEYRLLPFIKDGFERGGKAFHVVDPKLYDAEQFLAELRDRRADQRLAQGSAT